MKRTMFTIVVFAVLICVLSGCGSGDEGREASRSNDEAIGNRLLSINDFPSGTKVVNGLPGAPCGPAAIISADGGETAESHMFAFGRVRVQEAVGSFSNVESAEAVFDGLVAPEHRECIRGAIESFGLQKGERITVMPSERFGAGDEDLLEPLVAAPPGKVPTSYFDIVAIRSRMRVIALAVIVTGDDPMTPVVGDLIRRLGQ